MGCHAHVINPPGYVMENYNAIGQWQTVDQLGGADRRDRHRQLRRRQRQGDHNAPATDAGDSRRRPEGSADRTRRLGRLCVRPGSEPAGPVRRGSDQHQAVAGRLPAFSTSWLTSRRRIRSVCASVQLPESTRSPEHDDAKCTEECSSGGWVAPSSPRRFSARSGSARRRGRLPPSRSSSSRCSRTTAASRPSCSRRSRTERWRPATSCRPTSRPLAPYAAKLLIPRGIRAMNEWTQGNRQRRRARAGERPAPERGGVVLHLAAGHAEQQRSVQLRPRRRSSTRSRSARSLDHVMAQQLSPNGTPLFMRVGNSGGRRRAPQSNISYLKADGAAATPLRRSIPVSERRRRCSAP